MGNMSKQVWVETGNFIMGNGSGRLGCSANTYLSIFMNNECVNYNYK